MPFKARVDHRFYLLFTPGRCHDRRLLKGIDWIGSYLYPEQFAGKIRAIIAKGFIK